ncbi:hypothetical protein U3A55_01055 [Salarchaeum sp. III]|uniref:hypothetical protein n=1 Tax=Salarchaeum sp. III TaxID=3107927 RepID=UPI002EDB0116
MPRNHHSAARRGGRNDSPGTTETSLSTLTRTAFRDARYVDRALERPLDQVVFVSDELGYAADLALAFLGVTETRQSGGCCVVTTERRVSRIKRDTDRVLWESRLGVVEVGIDESTRTDPYAETPVYSLSNVGDYASLFLTVDDLVGRFDGPASLVVHSLDALLAETSVRTVSRLLTLGQRLDATPQLFTLDSQRCSSDSLETIRSTVDAVVRIEHVSGEPLITVE